MYHQACRIRFNKSPFTVGGCQGNLMREKDVFYQLRRLARLGGNSAAQFHLPILQSLYESEICLYILRRTYSEILDRIEEEFSARICVAAFGSLGRLDFSPEDSDLDAVIIYEPSNGEQPSVEEIRDAVYQRSAPYLPWLVMDDRDLVIASKWQEISSVDLKYPVTSISSLKHPEGRLEQQRYWQILLESRWLYGRQFYDDLYLDIVPHEREIAINQKGSTSSQSVDFPSMIQGTQSFFASFEEPRRLHKSPYKYWKGRYLREFFSFCNIIAFILGYYLQLERRYEYCSSSYICAPIVLKLYRLFILADDLDQILVDNHRLSESVEREIAQILGQHDIRTDVVLAFPSRFNTRAAHIFEGIVLSLLTRFSACWERLHDVRIRGHLERLEGEDVAFEGRFIDSVDLGASGPIIQDLLERRKSYLKYMAALASIVDSSIGRVWFGRTVPRIIVDAIKPFSSIG